MESGPGNFPQQLPEEVLDCFLMIDYENMSEDDKALLKSLLTHPQAGVLGITSSGGQVEGMEIDPTKTSTQLANELSEILDELNKKTQKGEKLNISFVPH